MGIGAEDRGDAGRLLELREFAIGFSGIGLLGRALGYLGMLVNDWFLEGARVRSAHHRGDVPILSCYCVLR